MDTIVFSCSVYRFRFYSLTVFLRAIVNTKRPVAETAAKTTDRRFSASPVAGPRGVSSSGIPSVFKHPISICNSDKYMLNES